MEITTSMVEAVREWLGDEGCEHFQAYLDEHGTVSPVIANTLPSGKTFPHAVHFREGMQVRNFLRGLDDCKGWTDHDFDNHWAEVVTQALQDGGK